MNRAKKCVDANITNISFKNDSLVFQFEKLNSHHNGKMHLGP